MDISLHSLPFSDSFNFIYAIITLGDKSTQNILQTEKKQLYDQCTFLYKFLLKLNGEELHPLPKYSTAKKKFKNLFFCVKKSTCLSPDPLTSIYCKKILTKISIILAYYNIRDTLRKDIVAFIKNNIGGTTIVHINLLKEQFVTKSTGFDDDLVDEFKKFENEHLCDSIQDAIPNVIQFYMNMKSKLLCNIDYNNEIKWTKEIDSFNKKLKNLHLPPSKSLPVPKIELSYQQETINVRENKSEVGSPQRRSLLASPRVNLHSPKKMLQKARKSRSTSHNSNITKLDILSTDTVNSYSPSARKSTLKDLMKKSTKQPSPIPFPASKSETTIQEVSVRDNVKKRKKTPSRLSSYFGSNTHSIASNGWTTSKNISLLHKPEKDNVKEADDVLLLSLDALDKKMDLLKFPNTARGSGNKPVHREPSIKGKRLVSKCNGYWIESGSKHDLPIQFISLSSLEERDDHLLPFGYWFSKFFKDNIYSTYISSYGYDNFSIVNILKEKREKTIFFRILYKTSDKTQGLYIPAAHIKGKMTGRTQFLKNILFLIDPLINSKTYQKWEGDHCKELLALEKLELIKILHQNTFKIGLLNWKETNKNEEDMFSNCKISKEFKDFMNILGDKIKLNNWDKYSGGLDTSIKQETGKYSLFTNYEDSSIMFHVCPYLPYSKTDIQQLDRKRHIGNDVVLVVFNEASKPYLTSLIASQFNHVIIVVSLEKDENNIDYYSVVVTAKESVPTFGPALPHEGKFYSKDKLRKFLLQKIINGEKSASHAPPFLKRLCTSRSLLLRDIMDKNYNRC